MDKRLFLAFALSGAVVVATPLLFPPPKKAPAPAAPVAANAAAPTASPAVAPGAPSSASAAPVAAGASAPTAAPVAAPIVAETITVNDAKRHTTFSSLGAAPINVEIIGYKRLGGTVAGPVNIHQAREALLRYRVLAGRDTIDLSTVPFASTRSMSSTGATVMRFTATATASTGPVAVVFEYALQANDFTGQVQATVTGVTAPAFLLVDLPTGFVSQEADTSADLMALSYAAKPQKGGAKGMPFRKLDPGEQKLETGPMLWAVAKNKYFVVALLTNEKAPTIAEVHYEGGARTSKMATRAHATAVLPLTDGTTRFELYTGPQEWKRMRAMGRDFENANPYGGFMQGIVQPFATIVMRVLLWMKASTQLNYGWVLVIFGVGIRLLMWPLNQKAMRSSMQLQRIQPEMQALQLRYKSDPQKQQQEIMKLYAEHGMSPLSPLLGCLPMLLPMPILFALFFVFQNTIEFRGVPFLWLTDISMKDPYYILPLVMGASMYVLSWIGMRNAPPNPQAKMMAYVMPAMMTVFLLTFASGLNLYYTVQNLAALPQQWLIANERAKLGKKG